MKKIIITCVAILALASCGPGKKEDKADADTSRISEEALSESKKTESSKDYESEGRESQIQAGQMTAAEWNDLSNWNFWDSLNSRSGFSKMPVYWSYDLSKRISVRLKTSGSEPIINMPVELVNGEGNVIWQARTDNKGRAELWPYQKNGNQSSLKGLKLMVGGKYFENPKTFEEGINELVFEKNTPAGPKKIDIAYMVDATGSMGDELEYLKAELTHVIEHVKKKNQNIEINTGTVFYRDETDEYLVKKSDFSPGISETVNFIKEQSAGGGGDFPEAVHTALNTTVNELQWTSGSIKIAFLILDAPPHYNKQVTSEIHRLTAQAAAKGIKLIPITASGIDKETEFLMRYMAIASNGTYVFITDDSGIGNDHLEATVGPYQVEFLNNLMVRLISENL